MDWSSRRRRRRPWQEGSTVLDGLFEFVGSSNLVVFLGIVILVLLIAYIGSRYKVAKANEALIISGRRERTATGEQRLKVVRGQGTVVLPLLHRVGTLKLTARQINVNLADAVSRQGIKVAVQGVATFKIGADDESIQNAAERFLEARDEEVDSIVKNVLEGSLRSIVGTLTVEELNLDRQKFQQAVQDAAKGDLATSGLQIDSFTIQAIRDESGYMDLIGQQETARRERDARMAKAAADQEAAVREAEANQIKINAERDVSVRRAETEMQIAAAEARAAQAGPLAQAEAQQEVTRKQTELAQLEADRKQKELIASTIRPAEADAEAQIRRAEGEKGARIAQAQAEAERVKLAGQAEAAVTVTKGEAQARVVEVNAEATAKQTTLEGNAEAGIVLSKGEAEAKALELRAHAYRQFNEAAVIQTVLSMLPEIVRAAAEPMGNIGSLTVLSSEGASDIVKTTTRTVAEAGAAVKGLTGIDIPALLEGAMGGARAGWGEAPKGPSGGGGGGGSGGAGGGARTPRPKPGGAGPKAGASSAGGPTAPSAAATEATASPAWGAQPAEDPATAFARAGQAIERAATSIGTTVAATPADGGAPAAPPTAAEARRAAREAATTTPPAETAAARRERVARPSAASAQSAASARSRAPASVDIGRETTLDDAALRLANDLRAIPGIERFGATRLADLERGGPRPLRTMWRIARDQLDERYGQMTIGEMLDHAARRGGGPGQGASA
jgi:flotillin